MSTLELHDDTERRGIPREHTLTTSKEDELDFFLAQSHQFRREYEEDAAEWNRCVALELDLEHDRAGEKLNAILRIMQLANQLTGKPHSASSADAIVETDVEYRAYLKRQTANVVAKNAAYTRMQSAQMRTQLAVIAAKVLGGWSV